jgi:hypothetical protein
MEKKGEKGVSQCRYKRFLPLPSPAAESKSLDGFGYTAPGLALQAAVLD